MVNTVGAVVTGCCKNAAKRGITRVILGVGLGLGPRLFKHMVGRGQSHYIMKRLESYFVAGSQPKKHKLGGASSSSDLSHDSDDGCVSETADSHSGLTLMLSKYLWMYIINTANCKLYEIIATC